MEYSKYILHRRDLFDSAWLHTLSNAIVITHGRAYRCVRVEVQDGYDIEMTYADAFNNEVIFYGPGDLLRCIPKYGIKVELS